MAQITKTEAEQIMNYLESRGSFGISLIEKAVEEKVNKYRETLNEEVISKIKKKNESSGSIPCACGGVAESKGDKKK